MSCASDRLGARTRVNRYSNTISRVVAPSAKLAVAVSFVPAMLALSASMQVPFASGVHVHPWAAQVVLVLASAVNESGNPLGFVHASHSAVVPGRALPFVPRQATGTVLSTRTTPSH